MLDIKITKTTTPKAKPADESKLGFGKIFTDHMFIMNYTEGQGWHDARIVPYENVSLSPAAMVFHYGQEMFEGLKAYRGANGEPRLFRPDMNAKRTNATNERLCIPQLPEEDFVQAVKAVVKVDEDWIPRAAGTSLYIRPFIIATDDFLGVAPSKTYMFMIILSQVLTTQAVLLLLASGLRMTMYAQYEAASALQRQAVTTLLLLLLRLRLTTAATVRYSGLTALRESTSKKLAL